MRWKSTSSWGQRNVQLGASHSEKVIINQGKQTSSSEIRNKSSNLWGVSDAVTVFHGWKQAVYSDNTQFSIVKLVRIAILDKEIFKWFSRPVLQPDIKLHDVIHISTYEKFKAGFHECIWTLWLNKNQKKYLSNVKKSQWSNTAFKCKDSDYDQILRLVFQWPRPTYFSRLLENQEFRLLPKI